MKHVKPLIGVILIALVLLAAIIIYSSSSNDGKVSQNSNTKAVSEELENHLQEDLEIIKSNAKDSAKLGGAASDKSIATSGTEDLEVLIDPEFFTEPWKRKIEEIEKLMDVTIKEMAEPSDYSIKFNPTPNQTYRCVSVISSYMNSEKAMSRMVTTSNVSMKSDSDGAILVDYKIDPMWALTAGAELPELQELEGVPSVSNQFLVRDGALYLSQKIDGKQKFDDTQYFDGNIEQFTMDLPKEFTPELGSQWEVNRKKPYPYKATRTLVGFAEINGIKTAKIHSETELPIKMTVDTYVELNTGIVIRTESEIVTKESGNDYKMKAISQTILIDE